jgi:hypothetical protein
MRSDMSLRGRTWFSPEAISPPCVRLLRREERPPRNDKRESP